MKNTITISELKNILTGHNDYTGVIAPEAMTVKELIDALTMWEECASGEDEANACILFDITIR